MSRTNRIFFVVLTVLVNAISMGCVNANNESEDNSEKNTLSNAQTYVIGESKVAASFVKGMASMNEAFAPMDDGKILFRQGKYLEAKDKYLTSLDIHKKYKISEWLPRLRLAQVYEKLNDHENAISQLDWLINDCQSEITKKELIARRESLAKYTEPGCVTNTSLEGVHPDR